MLCSPWEWSVGLVLNSMPPYPSFCYQIMVDEPERTHYLSWWWPSWARWDWRQRCNHGQTCVCAHQSCGDGSRSGPCWAAGAHGRGSAPPASWGSPVCRCLRWCAPHNPAEVEKTSCYFSIYGNWYAMSQRIKIVRRIQSDETCPLTFVILPNFWPQVGL